MKIKKLTSSPIAIQAIVILSISIFHLILRLFKYTFVPSNLAILIVLDSSVVLVIIFLMIKAMMKHENAKSSIIICLFLPLIILLHGILKFFTIVYAGSTGYFADSIYLFILLLFSTIQISFICTGKRNIGIFFCFFNSIILLIIFLLSFIVIYFNGFDKLYVYDTVTSPGNIYDVEIIVSDRGDIGSGEIYFEIARINYDINLFIGTLKKDRMEMPRSKFAMFVEWVTDEVVHINGIRYTINDFNKGDYSDINVDTYYKNKDNYNYFISKIERFGHIDNVIVSKSLSRNHFDILEKIKYDNGDGYIELPVIKYEGINIYGMSLDGFCQRLFKQFIVNDNRIYYVIEYSNKSSLYHVVELSNEEKELIMSLLEGE